MEEFKSLLSNLQSSQNDIRSAAEQTYETIPATDKFNFLMNVILDNGNILQNRVFSGVLCRRLLDVSYDETFECLPKEQQDLIKSQILHLIAAEADATVRKKLTEVTLEIARRQFNDDGILNWPDLLTFVFNICINNSNEALRVTGLHIFSGLPNILEANTTANFNIIGSTLSKCLNAHNENGTLQTIEVRDAAVRALCSFVIQEFEDNTNVSQLKSLIPMMLKSISDSIEANPFDDNVMKSFIELVDEAPGFLKDSVTQILQLCISIVQDEEMDEVQKHLAIEVFVSLSESCTNAIRKSQAATHTMIQYLFKLLTDIEDDCNWSNTDEDEVEDDSSNTYIAEVALDRLAVAMKGKRLMEEIKQTVPAMLLNENWKYRHGGLKAITSMGEGLQKVMSESLGSIIVEVVKLLNDQHPRVRYAACVCIGQMSTDFEPKLQTMYHEQIMPSLMRVLDDVHNPRVQAYACSSLTNFCEGASKDILSQYLPVLAGKLLDVINNQCSSLVQQRRKLVLEQAITTVAAVSDTAGNKFDPYYKDFMSIMKWIMTNTNVTDLKLLRGKAIECISLMGLAVGKERFLIDGQEVMSLLMSAQKGASNDESATVDTEDPQHSYMISAWARICKLMGKDFAPYLEFVMGPVLETANMKPETCFMYDEETEDIDKDWQVLKVGQDQNMAINTSGIEDKINACQMLICYARELKEAFQPYVVPVVKIMGPLLKFYLNDDVRSAAADIVPFLIDSSINMEAGARLELWYEMLDSLLEALKEEEEKIPQADMLGAIGDGIEKMGRQSLDQARLGSVCELMNKFFDDLLKAQDARIAKRKADDYDDEEEDNMEADKDDDDNILVKLFGVNHALFKVYGEDAMGFFQQISGYVLRLLEAGRPYTDLQYGLCFIDDIIEYCGDKSYQYCSQFLQVFVNSLSHSEPEVRQTAVYGIGLMAQEGGVSYKSFLSEVAHVLVSMMAMEDCRSVDNNMSTENVISALTKLCKYQPQCVPGGDLNQFLAHWIQWLPIYEDDAETPHVYGYLCDLVEAHNPVIVGVEANVVRVIKSVATCINKEGFDTESAVYTRCLNVVKMVQSSEPLFNQCVLALTNDEQVALKQALDKLTN